MSGNGGQLAVGAADHVVQFYGSDSELAASVSDYLEAGLRAEGSALIVATAAHRAQFLHQLASSGLDIGLLQASGLLLSVDAAEMLASFASGERIDRVRFESVVGHLVGRSASSGQPVRIYAEMVALLWDAGRVPQALELEGLWNQLGSSLPFSLLCGYPARLLAADEMAQAVDEVCRLHAAVLDARPAAVRTEVLPPVIVGQRRFGESRGAASAARHFVLNTVASICDDPALAVDAAIVVTELAANAVLHARSSFTVVVSRLAGSLRISVFDLIPLPAVNGGNSLASLREGHGLYVISKIATRWSAEPHPDGKVVWADLQLPPREAS